ncbi:MAG TPA: hypothetical protein VLE22_11610 [Bryobacteraceae bacterium]|nr:hypothetical protein [Bryobacteraceae bacterium]
MLDTTRRKAATPIPARELGGSAYGAKIDCVFVTPWARSVAEATRALRRSGIWVHHADTIERARAMLGLTGAKVLLAEASFRDGNWQDAVALSEEFAPPVSVVVVTTVVDERFWITAIENGAYDLVSRPFSSIEFAHIVENAYSHAWALRGVHRSGSA